MTDKSTPGSPLLPQLRHILNMQPLATSKSLDVRFLQPFLKLASLTRRVQSEYYFLWKAIHDSYPHFHPFFRLFFPRYVMNITKDFVNISYLPVYYLFSSLNIPIPVIMFAVKNTGRFSYNSDYYYSLISLTIITLWGRDQILPIPGGNLQSNWCERPENSATWKAEAEKQ